MDGPLSLLLQPVYSEINPRDGSELIAHVMAVVSWKTLFENLLDQGKDEIDVVVTSCQDSHTFTFIGTMLSTLELETCTHWTLVTKQYPPLLLQANLEHQRFCVLTASKCI